MNSLFTAVFQSLRIDRKTNSQGSLCLTTNDTDIKLKNEQRLGVVVHANVVDEVPEVGLHTHQPLHGSVLLASVGIKHNEYSL